MLTCKRLRIAVILSAALLITGFALEVFAEVTLVGVPTSHIALLLIFGAVAILAVAFLLSLIPGASERLRECRH
jgi:hypothetical protein